MARLHLVSLIVVFVAAGCGDDSGDGVPVGDGSGATTTTGDGDGDGDGPLGPGWNTLPSVPGGPIQETAAVSVDGKVFVLGGFAEGFAVVDTVRVFDPQTREWSTAAPLPEAVHHANVAVVDGKIYVLGALQTLSFTPIGNVWEYDPANDDWTPRTPMSNGEARGSSFVGAIDRKIYVAGGLIGSQAVANVSVYDVDNDSWDDDLPDLPAVRDHGAFGVVDGVLYGIAGRRGGIATVEDTVFAFDPQVGDWQTLRPMPTARAGVASAVVGDVVVVAGGEGSNSDPGGVFPQVEAYRPSDDTWTTLDPMMTPRHGMGAAAIGNVFYTPGGATSQAFAAVDTHEALVLE